MLVGAGDALARGTSAQHGHGEAGVLGLLPARDVRHHRFAPAAARAAEHEEHRPAPFQQAVERAGRSVRGGQGEPLGGRAHPLAPPPPDPGPEPADRAGEGHGGEGPDRPAADQDEQRQRAEEGVAGHARPTDRLVGERSEAVAARPAAPGEVPPDGDAERREEAEGDGRAGRPGRREEEGPGGGQLDQRHEDRQRRPPAAGKPNAATACAPPARSRSFAAADIPNITASRSPDTSTAMAISSRSSYG